MSERTAILYLITSTNIGGTEKALFELIRRLNRDEFAVHVCSLKKPGGFAQRIASAADGFYSLGLGESGGAPALLFFPTSLFRLLRLIRRIRPAILHAFLFRANLYGRLAGRLAGAPAIISSVRVIEPERWAKTFIDRATSPLVDMYTAVTGAARSFTIEKVGIPSDKVVTIYNGIDCGPGVAADEAKPGGRPMSRLALIGRFHRQKGHAVFLEALKRARKQQPALRGSFWGEGPDEQQIRELTAGMGLSDCVDFMGVAEDMPAAMSRVDALVLPSLWEGFPNVLLEAMAAGRPVIASRISGIEEIVLNGETGLLCEPGNPRALADAMVRICGNPALASEMGRKGRLRAERFFSIDETVRKTVELYRRLLKKGFQGPSETSAVNGAWPPAAN